jgi:hypothetical protein
LSFSPESDFVHFSLYDSFAALFSKVLKNKAMARTLLCKLRNHALQCSFYAVEAQDLRSHAHSFHVQRLSKSHAKHSYHAAADLIIDFL